MGLNHNNTLNLEQFSVESYSFRFSLCTNHKRCVARLYRPRHLTMIANMFSAIVFSEFATSEHCLGVFSVFVRKYRGAPGMMTEGRHALPPSTCMQCDGWGSRSRDRISYVLGGETREIKQRIL
jgi:hypothetical protein